MTKSQRVIEKRTEIARLMSFLSVSAHRIDAIGNAQTMADQSCLPMTVFRLDGYGYSYANPILCKIFDVAKPELIVTWLPSRYFI